MRHTYGHGARHAADTPSSVQKCLNCLNCRKRRGIPTISNGPLSVMPEYTKDAALFWHTGSTSCVISVCWQTHGYGANTPSSFQKCQNCMNYRNRQGVPTIFSNSLSNTSEYTGGPSLFQHTRPASCVMYVGVATLGRFVRHLLGVVHINTR